MEINTIISFAILIGVIYLIYASSNPVNRIKVKRIFVDTSALIDGRIIPVAQAGFMGGSLDIPRSVINELQFMADQADNEKRAKARQGLDNIKVLQSIDNLNVNIFDDINLTSGDVDDRLIFLAKKYNGSICTLDFNLNKVAKVDDIMILNINDLAMNLRMSYLPGQKLTLKLTQKGQESNQALGHLDDGTMVVVENASRQIGKMVEVEFVRSLQTAAGKMMFAKIVGNDNLKKTRNIQHDANKSNSKSANNTRRTYYHNK